MVAGIVIILGLLNISPKKLPILIPNKKEKYMAKIIWSILKIPTKNPSFDPLLGIKKATKINDQCNCPSFSIGGINLKNLRQIKSIKSCGFCVLGAVNNSKEPEKVIKSFQSEWESINFWSCTILFRWYFLLLIGWVVKLVDTPDLGSGA